jgi:Large polyvalent protein associated domain 29
MTRYISAAETARLVRADLKVAFPGVTFSVKSSTYSMGSHVDVKWTGTTSCYDHAVVVESEGVCHIIPMTRHEYILIRHLYGDHPLLHYHQSDTARGTSRHARGIDHTQGRAAIGLLASEVKDIAMPYTLTITRRHDDNGARLYEVWTNGFLWLTTADRGLVRTYIRDYRCRVGAR